MSIYKSTQTATRVCHLPKKYFKVKQRKYVICLTFFAVCDIIILYAYIYINEGLACLLMYLKIMEQNI